MAGPEDEFGFKWEKPGRLRRAARKIIEFFIEKEPYEPPPLDKELDTPPKNIPEAYRHEWYVPEDLIENKEEKDE